MYGWCPARLTRHSRRAPCARALPTRTHTHLPQHKQHLGHTTPGGPCKELPPPTRSGRDPGTCSGSRHRAAQLCLAVPLGGWQVCRSPKPSLLYAADVPPAPGWCSVWGHPSAGHPSAPIQGRCPQLCSSLHPQISGPPRSHQEWGTALLATHKGHRKRSDWTTVSLVILQHKKRKFPTIIRAGRSCNHFLGRCVEQGPDALLGQCLTCPQEGKLL